MSAQDRSGAGGTATSYGVVTNAELRVLAELIARRGATPLQARRRLDTPDPALGNATPRATLRRLGGLSAVLAALRARPHD